MEKVLNIYEVLEIIREDQRQFDRTVANLKKEKRSVSFLGANSLFSSHAQTLKWPHALEDCAQQGNGYIDDKALRRKRGQC